MSTDSQGATDEHFDEGQEAPPRGVALVALIRWMILISFSALALFMVVRELGLGSPQTMKAPRAARWTCPMHPQIIQDEPGPCPICSMELVEISEQQGADSMPSDSQPSEGAAPLDGLAEITLTPERVQKIGVTTARATQRTFSNELEMVGVIAVDDARLAEVHAWVKGFIEYVKPLRVGDSVKRGELLATLYSPEIDEAEREYLLLLGSSVISSAGGAALLEAARSRLKALKISTYDIKAVEKAGKPLPLSIIAISSGVITEKNAVLGAAVEPEVALFKTVDLSVVFAIAEVYERDLARVKVGQQVKVTSESLSGEALTGEVSFVYPSVDELTRTRKVRVELPNPKQALLPGMFVKVFAAISPVEGLAIPRDALIETGLQRYVFLAHIDGRFTPRSVELGSQDGDFLQITSGLAEGDVVVLSAGFLLDAESRLRGGSR